MKTGFRGTFVISWSQTEIDGLEAAPLQSLEIGAAWSWRGDAVRVDGPANVLRLERTDTETALRKRAARMVRRLVGAALDGDANSISQIDLGDEHLLTDSNMVVTDGAQSYTVTVIDLGRATQPLLMFMDELPPRNTDLWIVHHSVSTLKTDLAVPDARGVICFTPGTMIETPDGPFPVEELTEGDRVQTKDNGAQEILWTGRRRMTGARLFAMPKLRPIRFRAGALGIERPDQELLVSPDHRMLIKGDRARDLFNTDEVLIAAKDLVNDTSIVLDSNVREVTYVHLLLPRHQIVWANGVETESFHPASAALSTLDKDDRRRLLNCIPTVEHDPLSYGNFARRNLSSSEAAILTHSAA